jgi:hypothetical protein
MTKVGQLAIQEAPTLEPAPYPFDGVGVQRGEDPEADPEQHVPVAAAEPGEALGLVGREVIPGPPQHGLLERALEPEHPLRAVRVNAVEEKECEDESCRRGEQRNEQAHLPTRIPVHHLRTSPRP